MTCHDRYEGLVGVVFLGGVNVNLQIVKNGYARRSRQYSKEVFQGSQELGALERRRGL